METDDLKKIWNAIPDQHKDESHLEFSIKAANHPILKKMKLQLTIELIGFLLLLSCYYTMFDGAEKLTAINCVLISAISIQLLHNFLGYNLYQKIGNADNVLVSLNYYLKKMKAYAILAIICRLLFATGLILFFTNGIQLSNQKWLIMACISLIFIVQLALLYKLWMKRINALQSNVVDLCTIN